ncbi:SH3 domain-containing protein [Dysgonomonas sp. 520]|uniref:SH3 domain-containing protein n=1 Tax=Dysgonomonas sp. 520 TaxID=2302931 RepID=UPI0013D203C1|nr:SH3 domain-containing protein [Dysgonomonas sp. 520]NDW09472.1 SH3 domain-containing protein [Dysgonomonas sp. 520]
MKIRILSLLTLVLSSISIYAQNSGFYYYNDSAEANKRYIYSNIANVRSGAGTGYEGIDKLPCGHEVAIFAQAKESSVIDDLQGYWVKIRYEKDGETKEGYLWDQNLSYTQLRRGNVKFVFGLNGTKKKDEDYTVAEAGVKAVKDNEIVSQKNFEVGAHSAIHGRVLPQTGLSGAEQVIELTYGGEACGIPTDNFYFVWTGTELVHLIRTTSVGDSGIYGYWETLVFPEQHRFEDIVVKMIGQYEEDETRTNPSTGDYELIYRYKTEMYKWNGRKLSQIDQNWKE